MLIIIIFIKYKEFILFLISYFKLVFYCAKLTPRVKLSFVQNWPSVQNCNSCSFVPACKKVFVQFCPLMQFCARVQTSLRAKVFSCNFVHSCNLVPTCNLVTSCNFVFAQIRPVPLIFSCLWNICTFNFDFTFWNKLLKLCMWAQ